MQNNELKLMVGDWVLRNGIETKVTPNMLLSLEVNPAFAGNIQPINLTPEIMDRIEGFKSNFKGHKDSFYSYILDKDYSILFSNSKMILTLKNIGNVKTFNNPTIHQLQQLIRLFTGKEIEIKW
jgi:hypothetical protein